MCKASRVYNQETEMFYQTHALCANENAEKLMLTFVYTKEYVPILAFQVV